MYQFQLDEEKIRRVEIRCGESGCDGTLVHTSPVMDQSPRVDDCCPVCGRMVLVKLSGIPKDQVIREELI